MTNGSVTRVATSIPFRDAAPLDTGRGAWPSRRDATDTPAWGRGVTGRVALAVLLGTAILAGCGGGPASTPTPCVVSYPPAIGANVIIYYPDVSDAQCPSKVNAVPGAARLLAVPTGAPLCSGTIPRGDFVKVFGDSLASHAICVGLVEP